MNIIKAKIILTCLCFLIGVSAYSCADETDYIKEILFETSPGESPYYLPLVFNISYFIDFYLASKDELPKKNYGRFLAPPYPPSTGYFWALNSGDIVFINRRSNKIFVLDLSEKQYIEINPAVDTFDDLEYLWVGPEDEIYVCLRGDQRENERPYFKYMICKYERTDGVYCLDDGFGMPVYKFPPSLIRISPENCLYIQGWGRAFGGDVPVAVFNGQGEYLYSTNAVGKTVNGVEFILKQKVLQGDRYLEVIDCRNNIPILNYNFSRSADHFNFKCTFENSLIIYAHREFIDETTNNRVAMVNLPVIINKNLTTDELFPIDLISVPDRENHPGNVCDVSINYLGEIYAMVVYFDDINVLTGDEKIILYRWRKR